MSRLNEYQQPVGPPVPGWTSREPPQRTVIGGERCRLEPLDATRHAADLFAAFVQASDGRDWTYMSVGPFADDAAYRAHVERAAASTDPLHFAVIDLARGTAVGTLAFMRIDPPNGVIEVGHVMFSPALQRTAIATEAQFLMMRHAFDGLGYRRYEWKCDSLNARSRRAALRLGFQFEGVFRQAIIYKGRSRDTAWYAILDRDWPAVRAAFQRWLSRENFDADGVQRTPLAVQRGADT
jgi:RimJ/RimL family protein N-acetyltransferase